MKKLTLANTPTRIEQVQLMDADLPANLFVILDTELTESLVAEGYVREFISKVQKQRKSNDYEVTDRIRIRYNCSDKVAEALENVKDDIMDETLAETMDRAELICDATELNDEMIQFDLTKAE